MNVESIRSVRRPTAVVYAFSKEEMPTPNGGPAHDKAQIGSSNGKDEFDRDALLARAAYLINKGDLQPAIVLFSHLINLNPQDTQAHEKRGELHYLTGHVDLALQDFNRLVEIAPHHLAGYTGKAKCFANRGEHSEAINVLSQVIKDLETGKLRPITLASPGLPKLIEKHPGRAKVQASTVKQIDAVTRKIKANLYAHRGYSHMQLEHAQEAEADLIESISLNNREALPYMNLATLYYQTGMDRDSVQMATNALRLNSDDTHLRVTSYYIRGLAHIKLSEFKDAVQDLSEALHLEPSVMDDPAFARRRGYAYQELGEYDKAADDFSELIRLAPTNPIGYFERGKCRFEQNKNQEAVADLTVAAELLPNRFEIYLYRGCSYRDMEQWEPAFADFKRVLDINPNAADGYCSRGILAWRKGNLVLALADLSEAIRLDPKMSDAYWHRGLVHIQQGLYEDGILDLSKVLEFNPKDSDASYGMGLCHEKQKHLQEALNCFDRAVSLNQNNAEAWAHRGYIQGLLGRQDKAESDFREALRRNPNNEVFKNDIEQWRQEIKQIKNKNQDEPQPVSVTDFLRSLGENKPEQLTEELRRKHGDSLNRAVSLIIKRRDDQGRLPSLNFIKPILKNGEGKLTAFGVKEAEQLTEWNSLPENLLEKLTQPDVVRSLFKAFKKLKQEHLTATLLAHRLKIPLS